MWLREMFQGLKKKAVCFHRFQPLEAFFVAFSLLCVKKSVFWFLLSVACGFVPLFSLAWLCFLICRIPDLRFASHLALCVVSPVEVERKHWRSRKRCLGV